MVQSPGVLGGAAFEDAPPQALSAAVVSDPIAGFPTHGGVYGALSTGDVGNIELPNDSGSTGTALGGSSVRGGAEQDVTVLRLDVTVPAGANCLTNIDFRFLSDEYPEYVGSLNDAFIAELDASLVDHGSNHQWLPHNFAFDPGPTMRSSINAAGAASMNAPNAQPGRRTTGRLPRCTAATPITPGPHRIYLTVFDRRRPGRTTPTVLVDNLRFGEVANVARDCKPGAQVVDDRRYVALGRFSFSSGFGVQPYFVGTHKDVGTTTASARPGRTRRSSRPTTTSTSASDACQGAVTKDFDLACPPHSSWGEKAQLDHLDRAPGSSRSPSAGTTPTSRPSSRTASTATSCCRSTPATATTASRIPVRRGDRPPRRQDPRRRRTITPYDRIFKDVRNQGVVRRRAWPSAIRTSSRRTAGIGPFLPGGRGEGIKKADQRWVVERIHHLDGIIKAAAARATGSATPTRRRTSTAT